jgi:hypothetical protein
VGAQSRVDVRVGGDGGGPAAVGDLRRAGPAARPLVRVAAAFFRVGGSGRVPLRRGGAFPCGLVFHPPGGHRASFPAGIVDGSVARAQSLLLRGSIMLAAAPLPRLLRPQP